MLNYQLFHISFLNDANSGFSSKKLKVCGLGEGDCDTDAQCAAGFLFVCIFVIGNEMRRGFVFLAKRFVSFISNVEHSGLLCGKENCQGTSYDSTDDCCMLPDGGGVI